MVKFELDDLPSVEKAAELFLDSDYAHHIRCVYHCHQRWTRAGEEASKHLRVFVENLHDLVIAGDEVAAVWLVEAVLEAELEALVVAVDQRGDGKREVRDVGDGVLAGDSLREHLSGKFGR